jgi:hypothetical protein
MRGKRSLSFVSSTFAQLEGAGKGDSAGSGYSFFVYSVLRLERHLKVDELCESIEPKLPQRFRMNIVEKDGKFLWDEISNFDIRDHIEEINQPCEDPEAFVTKLMQDHSPCSGGGHLWRFFVFHDHFIAKVFFSPDFSFF